MLIALRIAFYLQFLLGAARFLFLQTQAGWTSWITNERLWETHTSLGVLVAVLALIALRPHPRLGADSLRTMARLAPLLPLLTGMLILSRTVTSMVFIVLHVLLGLAALGLIEMAAGRQRRALSR